MKKNITINLCGRLFNIDEDAYEMLSTYEQSLRNYFRSREDGEEIAEDLEARIAELLDEVKAQGTEAITIEHYSPSGKTRGNGWAHACPLYRWRGEIQ